MVTLDYAKNRPSRFRAKALNLFLSWLACIMTSFFIVIPAGHGIALLPFLFGAALFLPYAHNLWPLSLVLGISILVSLGGAGLLWTRTSLSSVRWLGRTLSALGVLSYMGGSFWIITRSEDTAFTLVCSIPFFATCAVALGLNVYGAIGEHKSHSV